MMQMTEADLAVLRRKLIENAIALVLMVVMLVIFCIAIGFSFSRYEALADSTGEHLLGRWVEVLVILLLTGGVVWYSYRRWLFSLDFRKREKIVAVWAVTRKEEIAVDDASRCYLYDKKKKLELPKEDFDKIAIGDSIHIYQSAHAHRYLGYDLIRHS